MKEQPVKHLLAKPAWPSAFVLLLAAVTAARADDPAPPDADALVKQLSGETALQAVNVLDALLRAGDKNAEDVAAKVLAAKEQFVKDKDVLALLNDDLAKKPVLAARLVVRVVLAQRFVAQFKKGSVVVGQIAVEDGKADVEDVLAQTLILPEGYFAADVGDLKRPISFRAPGYDALDVPLEGKSGDLVYVGKAVLKPLKKGDGATLKGTVALDGEKSAEGATVTLSMSVPTPNTPHSGYSPRPHWPEGVTVPVSKTGEFVATGLSPAKYFLNVTAEGHVPYSGSFAFKAGEEKDAGVIHVYTTDAGFYIGKPAPKAEKLAWEKDYAAALARAKKEKKPIFVMETATWCGWCKKLEKDTLDDPWVRHALSDYVVVQAFEDKEVEGKYGCDGYPTLVFADSDGKMAHKFVGYRQAVPFLEQLALADQKLGLELPEELKTLADKKVITLGAAAARPEPKPEPDKRDEELKWAKGVAEDFLAAHRAGNYEKSKLLMNKELTAAVNAEINWFNHSGNAGLTGDGASTILEEIMAPDKEEAVFRGREEGRAGDVKVQNGFTVRVAKDKESGKWRVCYYSFGGPAPADKKP
jgi:hypothetical protein